MRSAGAAEAEGSGGAGARATRRAALMLALGGLAGCAPGVAATDGPRAGLARPQIVEDAFLSFDGARLPLRVWAPEAPSLVIAALHGFDDYSRAFEVAGPFAAAHGAALYAYDQRGFGGAPDRGRWPGERVLAEDLRVFTTLLRARHPEARLAVLGESMGGAVAIEAFASPRPPAADALALLSPAVWGWSEQPVLNRVGLWLAGRVAPGLALTPPRFVSDAYAVCDDPRVLAEMDSDPLEIDATRGEALYGLADLMERASRSIGRVRVPVLYAYGGQDRMIPLKAAYDAASRLGSNGVSAFYPDGWHLLDRDLQAPRILSDVLAFCRRPTRTLPSGAGPIPRPETTLQA